MEWDRIIIGIDPGTNVMGYGVLGIKHRKPTLIAMGVLMLNKFDDRYLRLRRISERVTGLIEQYLPDEMAIEAPFYGKNVQSMLKLGRAQGVAMAAALVRDIPIAEYAPLKVNLDATDALGVALCHFYESSRPQTVRSYRSWKDFVARNPEKIKG